MLRNQAKKQGGFYVCAACRRHHNQHLAQLRSGGRARGPVLSPAARSFSSSALSISKLPNPRRAQNRTARPHDHVLSRTVPRDVRQYAAWGKFGSNMLPGQTRTAWGGTSTSSQPAENSSTAWGGASSDSKTSPLSSLPGQAGSATGNQLPPARPTASAIFGSGFGITSSGPSNPMIGGGAKIGQMKNPWGSGNASPFASPSGMSPGKPTFGGSGMTPAKPTSGLSGITPAKSTSGLDAMTLRQTSKPETAPPVKTPPNDPSAAPQRPTATSDSPTRASASGGGGFQHSPDLLLDNTFRKPPSRPAPAGAEFPQLRRRGPRGDLFESTSPFKLPLKYVSSPQSSGTSSFDSPSHDFHRRPPKRHHSELDRKDRYPNWGSHSSLGSIAPADPFGAVSGPRSPFPSDLGQNVRKETPGSREPVGTQSQLQRERAQNSFSRVARTTDRSDKPFQNTAGFRTPEMGSEPGSQMKKLEAASMAQSRPSQSFDSANQGSWESPKSDEKPSGETLPAQPREIDHEVRAVDNRRARGWDYGDDMSYGADLNHRGKAGKSKKRSGNRKSHNYEDDTGEGFDYEEAMAHREQRRRAKDAKRAAKETVAPKTIILPEYIAVYDLAEALRIKPARFLQDLEQLGFENILHDSVMTGETAALVAAEYGFEPTVDSGDDVDLKPRPPPEDLSAVPPRPPIVTIMGHVDHGKTTMLDFLRKSSVAAQEHGGITQHIGAFSVKLSAGKIITFLDTPGHAAFLSMRQRGANVTDIVVLVVAVDDSVKPQTVEAIKHAQNAKVPIIVAINKIDVDPNRIDHVKQDLATHGVEIEDFGGDVQVVAVSGKTGQGMNDLEETILTLSEILDVRAETDGMAEGWIIEASVKKSGKAATVLVKRGTLRIGDLIVAGQTYTRIRVMVNEAGAEVTEAGPGTPVEIYGGWKESPLAGDMVLQAPDETKAQAAVNYRQEIAQRALAATQKSEKELADREKAERETLKKLMEKADEDAEAEAVDLGPKLVNIIVKGDVMGSVEAVCGEIEQVGSNEVRPRILQSSPGQITESDVDLMATAKGYIVNFNNVIPGFILRRAEDAGVQILDHNIIYEVVSDVKRVLSEQLAPTTHQRVLAEAEVLQLFPINTMKRQFKTIAGVKIRSGAVTRGGSYRVMRDREKIHEGKLEALKQGKKDVTEMRKGTECGMMFEDFDDFQTGDIIQLFETIEEQRHV